MTDPSRLDVLWLLLCSGMIFLMQAGFMCLESGLTRSKNSINVAIKNLADFGISIIIFWAFGFALMFGNFEKGWTPLLGWEPSTTHGWRGAFFLFQAMFCATSATILSGATAERMRFNGYLLVTLLVAGIIYPIFGHWAWNGIETGNPRGWLGNLGFVDFAGSTVVHSVGGWTALAALLVIGPREGRFPAHGPPARITGGNLPLSMLGVLFLWLGWFGFNGGSTFGLTEQVPGVLTRTLLAGATGALTTLGVGWLIYRRPEVNLLMMGSLAGLVAITASSHIVSSLSSVLIGGIGGVIALGVKSLLDHYRVDDAISAVPIHLGAGIWGTLAVAVFGQLDLLHTGLNRWSQFGAQAIGIVACGAWAFGLGFLLLRVTNRLFPLRVTPEQEHNGLNISEHGATTELIDLLHSMDHQAQSGDMSSRVPVEPFTEIGQIARQYNRVLDTVNAETRRREAADAALREEAELVRLLEHISSIANQSASVDETFQHTLDYICRHTGWPVGHAFLHTTADSRDELISMRIWHLDHPHQFATFRQITEQSCFTSGIGLPGRVLATGEPAWIADITLDHNFPRSKLAANLGVKAGFAFPILVGGEVGAVLEFFSANIEQPDAHLLHVMASVGIQLGRVMERQRAKQALQGSHDQLEQRVDERTAELADANLRLKAEISERRLAEEELRSSEARLTGILELAPDAVISIDHNHRITLFNDGAERIFGYAAEEVLGSTLDRLLPDRFRIAHRQQVQEFADSRTRARWMSERREIFGRRKDGTEFPAEASISKLLQNGHIICTVILRDITARKQAEERMAHQAQELARSNAELESYAYVASHDLQEPLRGVAGCLGLLERRYRDTLDSPAQELIKHAVEGAMRMRQLIEDLLMYSRVRTRNLPFESVDCEEILRHTQRALQPMIHDTGAVITAAPLPHVTGDPMQITQVFQNLLTNALKFHQPHLAPVIHIGATHEGNEWVFSVSDQGIGIESRYADRIFTIFQRLHTRAQFPGTGIGLAICKKVVERHNGRIWFTSEPGRGTTFYFSIPADQEQKS